MARTRGHWAPARSILSKSVCDGRRWRDDSINPGVITDVTAQRAVSRGVERWTQSRIPGIFEVCVLWTGSFGVAFVSKLFRLTFLKALLFERLFPPAFESLEFFEWFSCHDRSNRFLCLFRYHFGELRGVFPSQIIRHRPAEPPSIPRLSTSILPCPHLWAGCVVSAFGRSSVVFQITTWLATPLYRSSHDTASRAVSFTRVMTSSLCTTTNRGLQFTGHF
jgi:hypothetical protein